MIRKEHLGILEVDSIKQNEIKEKLLNTIKNNSVIKKLPNALKMHHIKNIKIRQKCLILKSKKVKFDWTILM